MWLLMFRVVISTGKKGEDQVSLNAQKTAANLGSSLQLLNRRTPAHGCGLRGRIWPGLAILNPERRVKLLREDGIKSSGGEVCVGQKDQRVRSDRREAQATS